MMLRWPLTGAQVEQWKDDGGTVLGKFQSEAHLCGHESDNVNNENLL